MKAKDVFFTVIKKEIEISVNLAKHWAKYQELSEKEGYKKIAQMQFLDNAKYEMSDSLFIHKEYFLEWLKDQFGNRLPNNSSGSTMTALLDVDSVFNTFEEAISEIGGEDDDTVEELYTLTRNYQLELLGNLRVEQGIDLY